MDITWGEMSFNPEYIDIKILFTLCPVKQKEHTDHDEITKVFCQEEEVDCISYAETSLLQPWAAAALLSSEDQITAVTAPCTTNTNRR